MHIEHNFSLVHHNTFRVDCQARYFVSITSPSDFIDLLKTPERHNSRKKLFLGGGSNMLITTPTFDGLVVHNAIMGKDVVSDTPHEIFLKVGGGENRSDFVRRSIEQGLYGIENLVSIPGNVAAAPIQNIGAYGMDIESTVMNVGGIDLRTGTYETISHKDCQFAYRDSVFKHVLKENFFITDVTFRLQHFDPDTYAPIVHYGSIAEELQQKGIIKPTPKDVSTMIAEIRARKLPDRKQIGTAGSFFKNVMLSKDEYEDFLINLHNIKPELKPEFYSLENEYFKIPTGWILDHVLGYRGYRDGNVGCREHQALCLVNYGGATGQEVVNFSKKLQKDCQDKLGIHIEPEVNFIQ